MYTPTTAVCTSHGHFFWLVTSLIHSHWHTTFQASSSFLKMYCFTVKPCYTNISICPSGSYCTMYVAGYLVPRTPCFCSGLTQKLRFRMVSLLLRFLFCQNPTHTPGTEHRTGWIPELLHGAHLFAASWNAAPEQTHIFIVHVLSQAIELKKSQPYGWQPVPRYQSYLTWWAECAIFKPLV